jgi:iron(II)-dependent oxidoreductase
VELLERMAAREAETWIDIARFLANHERQHSEIIGTVRWLGGLYIPRTVAADSEAAGGAFDAEEWIAFPNGARFARGALQDPDAWDNELEAHELELKPYSIRRCAVTQGEWLEFIDAGGYDEPNLWSDAGWRFRMKHQLVSPLSWERSEGGWTRRTLHGPVAVDKCLPVSHVSWYEAEAFAAFCGARLPTEAEWEYAAAWDPHSRSKRRWPWGNRAGSPQTAELGARHSDVCSVRARPEADSAAGARQMVGNVWEWVGCTFQAYPGFRPQAYAEYSAPWFDGHHKVARGGTYLSQPEIARTTFRNFYVPELRQPALGLRLAKDA